MTDRQPSGAATVRRLVEVFYERARQDDLLGPVFETFVGDWDRHHRVVTDFWSDVLLRTEQYDGRPYPPHMRLPVTPEHFDRWLTLFTATADEVLPAEMADLAKQRARLMAESFRTGLFALRDDQGHFRKPL